MSSKPLQVNKIRKNLQSHPCQNYDNKKALECEKMAQNFVLSIFHSVNNEINNDNNEKEIVSKFISSLFEEVQNEFMITKFVDSVLLNAKTEIQKIKDQFNIVQPKLALQNKNNEVNCATENNSPSKCKRVVFSNEVNSSNSNLNTLCEENKYLLESDKVSQLDREILRRVMLRTSDSTELSGFLYNLCYALEAYWGRQAIILIDEYDVPISYAEQNGYYKQMICFMRDVLGTALKTNNSLEFAVLTGCLRIAKESIFTGVNNFACYSVSNAKYADKFGFTEDEVDYLLGISGFSTKKSEFKEWYDGYRFGNNVGVYCPWDILVHIDNLKSDPNLPPQTYWNNTSGNVIVRTLVESSDGTSRQKIERLVSGESIEENIVEDLTYDIVYKNEKTSGQCFISQDT